MLFLWERGTREIIRKCHFLAGSDGNGGFGGSSGVGCQWWSWFQEKIFLSNPPPKKNLKKTFWKFFFQIKI